MISRTFTRKSLKKILDGNGRACELPEFGEIYWDVEETSVLKVAGNLDEFYAEFRNLLEAFLNEREIPFDTKELARAIQY
jgi:hypothetical protein